MNKIIPEKIIIRQIKLYKVNLTLSEEFLGNPKAPDNYSIRFGHESSVDFDSRAIRIRLETILDATDQSEGRLGIHAEYGIEFHFIVENLDDFLVEKDGDKHIDSMLGSTILSIAFSTSRGIILERTQGTYIEGIILPVVDPKELLMHPKQDE